MKKLLLVLLFVPLVSFGQSAEDYFNSAQKKDNLKDYKGAIADYTKVIELAPNNINSYYNRGTSKANLKDYKGAIADYTKAIELSPNFAAAYYNRGINKYYLKDIIGACKDAGKAKQFGYNASQLINETCGTPKFIINENFEKITSDYWDKEKYTEDLLKFADKTDLNFKIEKIKRLAESVLKNKDVLFFVEKTDFKSIIAIEKSKMDYDELISVKEDLCKMTRVQFGKMAQILSLDCSQKKIKGFDTFFIELNLKIEQDFNYEIYNWSSQYWMKVNNSTYHITVNSDTGLKIEDVLINIK